MARPNLSETFPSLSIVSAIAAALPATRPRLSTAAAFYLLASMSVSFLAGSSAPTPLYGVYQAAWGFSPITVTVIFGIYAIAVLSMLVTVGALSDRVGRRPVLIAATLAQAATMLIFATAGGVPALIVARVLQGLSTGAAAAALGAGMLDLDRVKGTVANSVAPMLGTATGGIASGLMVQFLPAPTRLVYLVLFVIFLVQAAGVFFMRETVEGRRKVVLAALKPQLHVPPAVRQPLFWAVPVLVAAWALPGFYGSLGPALVRRIVGSRALALGGLALFLMAASAALAVLIFRARSARFLLTAGAVALLVGVGLTLLAMAVPFGATVIFFAGTAVAGVGFGIGFQGAIRAVLPLAGANERAGVLSVLYTVSYMAMGVPAVIAGVGVVYGGGLLATARQYGVVVMALAAFALVGRAIDGGRPAARLAAPR